MEDQLGAFLEFLATERNYSDNTVAAYRNDLSQFMTWLTGQHPEISHWAEARSDIVASYVESLKQKSYTASSVARKIAAILCRRTSATAGGAPPPPDPKYRGP